MKAKIKKLCQWEAQHLKVLNFEFGFISMSHHTDSVTQEHGCNIRKPPKCKNCLMDGADASIKSLSFYLWKNNIHEVIHILLFILASDLCSCDSASVWIL